MRYVNGGGTACYIHKDLAFSVVEAPQIGYIKETKYLLVSINCTQKPLVATIYRFPGGEFFSSLQSIMHLYDNIVLEGDLNFNLLTDDYYGIHLKRLVYEHALYLVPFGATHHLGNSDTWIDVILIDSESKLRSYEKSEASFINGHDYLIIDYTFHAPATTVNTSTTHDFRNFSPALFSESLTIKLHAQSTIMNDVNIALLYFQKSAIQLFDSLAPFTRRKLRSRPLPWFTQALKDGCKERDRFYKRVKGKRNDPIFQIYRSFDSRLKREISMARDSYISQNCTDSSKTWASLRKFGIVRRNLKSPLRLFSKVD